MMKNANWRARLRYQFDKSMAAGPIALIAWLGLVSLAIIAVAAVLLAVTQIAPEDGEPLGLIDGLWAALMRTMDAGTLGGDNGWGFRLVMLVVTVGGIFVFSALIGVLNSGLESKLDQLRKGRSKVLEQDHTIIFNWSPSIFDVISELVIANQSRRKPRIVIMAERDKVEMEEEIASKVGDLKNTRIICRSGEPTDLFDIGIVSPETARSIIILSPEGDDPDSQVVKTVLALVNGPGRRPEPFNIAAEIRDAANAEVARVVGGNEVQLVLADDLIARVVVQSTRQPGLSAVFTELLDFDGCEIYVTEQPELAGKSFAEAVMAYDKCALIGLCDADGQVTLNPDGATIVALGSKAILIAEDDDEIATAAREDAPAASAIAAPPAIGPVTERTLLIGWNRRAPMIALELSRYVGPNSLLTIAADIPDLEEAVAGLQLSGTTLTVESRRVDTSRHDELAALDPASYDHILVLGYSDHMAAQPADTRTLVTLLHLRRIAEATPDGISVVSEMIDVRNRELAKVTRVEDFVVSNRLVSLMLAQASENPYLEKIFADLLDEEGSEISLRPVHHYAPLGQPVSFYEVAEAALARGELAIGHHCLALEDTSNRGMGGIVINPTKSERTSYEAGDLIIVLARN
jgi:voltage-gated potassium channel Kch